MGRKILETSKTQCIVCSHWVLHKEITIKKGLVLKVCPKCGVISMDVEE
jgi:predicted RNA-binding Zn-ribbon protein involved in translation (DUF1610 family)